MIIRRDDAFRVICEIRTTVSATQERIGTGMFVSSPVDKDAMYGWIVTANHVAKDTNYMIILRMISNQNLENRTWKNDLIPLFDL